MTQRTQADGCQHWGDPGQNRESTCNRWTTVGTVALVVWERAADMATALRERLRR